MNKTIIFIFVFVFCSFTAFSENETQKYIVIFDKQNFQLSDNSNLLTHSLSNTLNLNSEILNLKTKLNKSKSIKKVDKIFPGAIVEISSIKEIQEIKKLPSVKKIIPDDILTLSVSNVTQNLLETNKIWTKTINGTNITGEGIKVAVFDSGIDITHSDFGTCENFNYTKKNYSGFHLNYTYETEHPYPNNNYTRFGINLSSYNANNFTIRFDRIVLDSSDYLRIYDKSNSLLQTYNDIRNKEDFFVNDDYIELEFTSNSFFSSYGYKINNIIINSSFEGYIDDSNCSNVIFQKDYVDSDFYAEDMNGHGSHVASLIGSKNPENINYKGIAPGVSLGIFKVCDSAGTCLTSDIISALNDAIDPNSDGDYSDKFDIVSMSIGFRNASPNYFLSEVFDIFSNEGIISVISAGNDGKFYGDYSINSPATSRSVISVGASFKDYEIYEIQGGEPDDVVLFSSQGPTLIGTIKPDVIAPGVYICGARTWNYFYSNADSCGNEEHVEISGTSMATPVTAGAIALIKQKHPSWNVKEIKATIKATALETNESYIKRGWGRIQPLKALELEKPSCIIEFNSSTYTYSVSNTSNHINLSYDTYCKNNYDYTELVFIPIDNFDDLSNYNTSENQILIFNISQNGSNTLEVPRNTFTKGFFKIKTFDLNSSYNNYDLLYVENNFSDFKAKNITLINPNSSNNSIPSKNYTFFYSIEKTGNIDENATITVIKYYNPLVNFSNILNPFIGENVTLFTTITSSNFNVTLENISLNQTGNYCIHVSISSSSDNFIQNDSYLCNTISENNVSQTPTLNSNISISSDFIIGSNITKIDKITNLEIINTKSDIFNFNASIFNLNSFSLNTTLYLYQNYFNKVKVNQTQSFVNKYSLNLSQYNSTIIKDILFSYENNSLTINSTTLNKKFSLSKDSIIPINNTVYEVTKENDLITILEFKYTNSTQNNMILAQNSTLFYESNFSISNTGIYTFTFSNIENYTGNEIKVNRLILCKYNNSFYDINKNGIGDSCEEDIDFDAINDSQEKNTSGFIIGNENMLNQNNLTLTINNSKNTTTDLRFYQILNVSILEDSTNISLIEFDFDFINYSLDLSELIISKEVTSNKNSLVVSNLNLFNLTKTIYLEKSINSNQVCIKDEEINSTTEISSSCDQSNEYILTCNNTSQIRYLCYENNGAYVISGLKNSGVIEYEEDTSGSEDGSGSGSGGGGGGSSGGGSSSSSSNNIVYIPSITPDIDLENTTANETIFEEEDKNSIDKNTTNTIKSNNNTTIFEENKVEKTNPNIVKKKKTAHSYKSYILFLAIFITIIVSIIALLKIKKNTPKLSEEEKEILNYIIHTRKLGFPISLIKNECLKHGWNEKKLDKLIKIVNKKANSL